MPNSDSPLHVEIRDSRLGLKWSQANLARRVDCSQSAISLLEQGRYDVLSDQKIRGICDELGIPYGSPATKDEDVAAGLVLKFCPFAPCILNIPFDVGGKTCYRPTMIRADQGIQTYCSECGELLLEQCACSAPLTETPFCPECGAARVVGVHLTDEQIERKIATHEKLPTLTRTRVYRHVREKRCTVQGSDRESGSRPVREHVEVEKR